MSFIYRVFALLLMIVPFVMGWDYDTPRVLTSVAVGVILLALSEIMSLLETFKEDIFLLLADDDE